MKKLLELAAYVFLIAASVTVMYRQSGRAAPEKVRPKVGAPLKLSTSWEKPTNVVIAMSSVCHFCQESVPLYRQLGEAALAGKISLTLTSFEPAGVFEPFVARSKIAAGHIISSASFADLHVSGTPTLMVVDHAGIVRKVLVGKQPDEARLLAELIP